MFLIQNSKGLEFELSALKFKLSALGILFSSPWNFFRERLTEK